MIDSDNLKSGEIQRKLRSKEFILVNNIKAAHDLWKNDIALVGIIDKNGQQKIFDVWAACKNCFAVYRTHSKKDEFQNRKNYGLTSLHLHVNDCRLKSSKSSLSSTKDTSQKSSPFQTLIPRFVYNKNQLSELLQNQLKDAELKFVTAGGYSFNCLENGGILDLVQTSINIGAQMGNMNVHDIFYGRKTIRAEAITRFNHFSSTIGRIFEEPIKNHCIAATCDM